MKRSIYGVFLAVCLTVATLTCAKIVLLVVRAIDVFAPAF